MVSTEAQEMIRKHGIFIQGENLAMEPTPAARKDLDRIKALKPEIMAELRAREQAELDRQAAEEAARVEEARAIRAGELKIKVSVGDYDGIPLYEVYGEAAEALKEIGAARDVAYSTQVNDDIIKALGLEFTLPQAAELTRPAREKKAAEQKAKDDARQAKFDEARKTGRKVELSSWMEDCDHSVEECSTDFVQEYAMPDGTTKRERQHTY